MRILTTLGLALAFMAGVSRSHAIDLKQSKVTQVVNDVQIISAASQNQKAATVNDVFAMPDILRTGVASRAELIADDETVTRVGANTIFSFDPANRTIDLKQGSLLFHSPHGKGGGSIHTGSATASVLGTTVIVSTTPDGGMKVLDLEGNVAVTYSNKLSQQLNPGQMTFVLPGGKQLAPVILFRMDELVKHSQLVSGFDHPLASLPLILGEIEVQLKQLKSGRVSDTGLLVGDHATPNQVEVLDLNTVQNVSFSRNNLQSALQTDATITTSSLTDPGIPTPPNRIFLSDPITLTHNSFYSGQSFLGFAGNNVSFTAADALAVNLTPYAPQPIFDFVAAGTMNFNTSVTFSGLSASSKLELVGGTGMTFAPNITLSADVADFEISSAGTLSMTGGSLVNNTGNIALTSGDAINLLNTSIVTPGLLSLTAQNAINITWDASVWLAGNNQFTTLANDGSVTLTSVTGSLTVDNTSITTHYLTLGSGDSILLDGSGQSITGVGANATANVTAPILVSVNNCDLSTFGSVNMAANTINLVDVAFGTGSTVTLSSQNGVLAPDPNTGAVSVPGDVNFISGVTYGGQPAQNFVNGYNGYNSGNGSGITITTLH